MTQSGTHTACCIGINHTDQVNRMCCWALLNFNKSTSIYLLLINKHICDRRNKFVCLPSKDLVQPLVRVFTFFPHFLCYPAKVTFLAWRQLFRVTFHPFSIQIDWRVYHILWWSVHIISNERTLGQEFRIHNAMCL